jgi:hypothetical protein
LKIVRSVIGLEDVIIPEVDWDCCDGELRGVARLSFTASDSGSGVYRSILSLDGVEVGREVVDGNAGRCGDVETGNGDAYEFSTQEPCPLAVNGDLDLDTRTLADGAHTLSLRVEDAAGNLSLAVGETITTHNAPIALSAPSLAGEARVGSALTAGTGQWDGAPTGYDHRWLRCDGDGDGCVPIAGASGSQYVPVDADAYHRVVAEVLAANGSGAAVAHSAPSAVVADAAGRTAPPDPTPAGDDRPGADTPGDDDPSGERPGSGDDDPASGERPGSGDDDPGSGQRSGSGGDDRSGGGAGGGGAGIGGVPDLRNPLADQSGRAPNGTGAAAQARVSIALRLAGGGTAQRARSKRDRRWTVVGRVTDPQGKAIEGARLNVVKRVSGRGWVARGLVRSGADGRFTLALPPGPSRTVKLTYFPFGDSNAFRTSNSVTIDVFAPLTIKTDRRVVSGKRVVTIRGRAGGESIPSGGLLVTLQGYQRGYGWRTFRTLRSSRNGSWRTRYRFRATSGRFAFRAIVPRQGRYPFVTTTSAAVSVTVR